MLGIPAELLERLMRSIITFVRLTKALEARGCLGFSDTLSGTPSHALLANACAVAPFVLREAPVGAPVHEGSSALSCRRPAAIDPR